MSKTSQERIRRFFEDKENPKEGKLRELLGESYKSESCELVEPMHGYMTVIGFGASGLGATADPGDEWRELGIASDVFAERIAERIEQLARIEKLEERCKELEVLVSRVKDCQPIVVPIATLDPEPYDLIGSIPVVIRQIDGEHVATFFDANINTSGDTEQEAFESLKSFMIDVFEELEKSEGTLGPELRKQLAVLRKVIRRRA